VETLVSRPPRPGDETGDEVDETGSGEPKDDRCGGGRVDDERVASVRPGCAISELRGGGKPDQVLATLLDEQLPNILERLTDLEERTANIEVDVDGLKFFRADKDDDQDFDALTDGTWEAATPAAAGTINWITIF